MKSKSIILLIGILVIVALSVMMILWNPTETNVETFHLLDFQWAAEQFPLERNIGKIDDKNVAMEKSKEVWKELFHSINGKPIKVYFDSKNDCWYLHGTLPPNWDGGVPHIIVKSNGDVGTINSFWLKYIKKQKRMNLWESQLTNPRIVITLSKETYKCKTDSSSRI